MTRTVINLPDKFHFSMEHEVTVNDLNYGTHLGADKILTIALEAQMRFVISLGYDGLTSIEGQSYTMVDSETLYKAEVGHEKRLLIEVTASNFGKWDFEFLFRFSDSESKNEIAAVKMGYIFFDYTNHTMVEVPQKFRRMFVAPGAGYILDI